MRQNGISNARKGIPILLYHYIEPRPLSAIPESISLHRFESQLDYLQKGQWVTLNFKQVHEAIRGFGAWPRRSVWITFDDGDLSVLDYAVPALCARGLKATVFAVAAEIGGFNRWDTALGRSRRELLDEEGFRRVLACGMEIGSHGWAHRDLQRCSDDELSDEIVRSRQELQGRLGCAVDVFAYPYGRHSARHFPRLVGAGYHGAVSIQSGPAMVGSNVFAMRRIPVQEHDTQLRFRLKLSPLFLNLRNWWRR